MKQIIWNIIVAILLIGAIAGDIAMVHSQAVDNIYSVEQSF